MDAEVRIRECCPAWPASSRRLPSSESFSRITALMRSMFLAGRQAQQICLPRVCLQCADDLLLRSVGQVLGLLGVCQAVANFKARCQPEHPFPFTAAWSMGSRSRLTAQVQSDMTCQVCTHSAQMWDELFLDMVGQDAEGAAPSAKLRACLEFCSARRPACHGRLVSDPCFSQEDVANIMDEGSGSRSSSNSRRSRCSRHNRLVGKRTPQSLGRGGDRLKRWKLRTLFWRQNGKNRSATSCGCLGPTSSPKAVRAKSGQQAPWSRSVSPKLRA